MSLPTFTGTIPALVTPFTRDDRVNVTVLQELVDYLLARRVHGFYLCGTTSEGAFMTVEERQLIVETVVKRVNGRVPVFVQVGAAAVTDAIRLAQHARACGASGISSILPPVLYDERGIVAYYTVVAEAVPDVPFFPYLFDGKQDTLALMRNLLHIPNLAGAKYTGPNMYELGHLAALRKEGWTIFAGMDEQLVCALMFGARANIGSTVNLMPGAHRAIHTSYLNGDVMGALALQKRINRVIDCLLHFGLAGSLKVALGFLGFDCGEPRIPNLPLPEHRREELRAALQAADFFDLAAM